MIASVVLTDLNGPGRPVVFLLWQESNTLLYLVSLPGPAGLWLSELPSILAKPEIFPSQESLSTKKCSVVTLPGPAFPQPTYLCVVHKAASR